MHSSHTTHIALSLQLTPIFFLDTTHTISHPFTTDIMCCSFTTQINLSLLSTPISLSLPRSSSAHPLLWGGVATISRLLNIIGLFCRIWSLYRALLQKRPITLRSLLIVATPYSHHSFFLRYTYQSFFTTHINLFLLTTRTIGTPYFTTHTGALDLRIVTIWILDVTYGISGANMPEILEVGIYYVRQRLNVTCGISGTNVPTIP